MPREELEAALDETARYLTIFAAARKQLALMPEICGMCGGSGLVDDGFDVEYVPCPTCHGSGKVYPPELVERIADARAKRKLTRWKER